MHVEYFWSSLITELGSSNGILWHIVQNTLSISFLSSLIFYFVILNCIRSTIGNHWTQVKCIHMDSICFFGERLKSFIILNINEIVGGGGLEWSLSLVHSLYLSNWIHVFFSQHCRRIYRLIVVLTQWGVFVLRLIKVHGNQYGIVKICDVVKRYTLWSFELLFCLSNRLR